MRQQKNPRETKRKEEKTMNPEKWKKFLHSAAFLLAGLLLYASIFPASCGAGNSTESTNPFKEAPYILFDEELLLVSPLTTGKTSTECMCPNSDSFSGGEWKALLDHSWTKETPLNASGAGDFSEFATTMLRTSENQALLAQAWKGEGDTAHASLLPVDKDGFHSAEYKEWTFPGNVRGLSLAAGDFLGDNATELLAGYVDEGTNSITFSISLPDPAAPDPVVSTPNLPAAHSASGVRIATGDADGDGQPEAAAMYVDHRGKYVIALFSVGTDRTMSLLGTHETGLSFSATDFFPSPQFDLTFADWDGSGEAMLLCSASHLTGDNNKNVTGAFHLIKIDLSGTSPSFHTIKHQEDVFSYYYGIPILRGVRVGAGDVDGDGKEELFLAHGAAIKKHNIIPPEKEWETTVSLALWYQTPYMHSPTGVSETSTSLKTETFEAPPDYPLFDLAVGHFTGQLNPAASSKNRAQALISLWDPDKRENVLTLYSLRRYNKYNAVIDGLSNTQFSNFSGNMMTPLLVTGDLDGDSMLLGTPTHITLENQITPLLFLNEPPKHVAPDASGNETNYSRYSDMFIQYAQSESESEETTNKLDVESNIGASVTAKEEMGVNLGVVKASTKEKTTVSASVGAKYKQIEKDFSSQSTSLTGQTNRDDFVLYRCHTINIWRYPILGWKRTAEDEKTQGQAFYQVVIPRSNPEDEAVHLIAGRNVDWYQPVHMNGNVLSYPSASTQISDFTEDNLLSSLVTLDVGGGNSATRTIEWSSKTSKEKLKSLSVSMAADYEVQFSASLKGEFLKAGGSTTLDFHMDNRVNKTASSTTSVTKENAFNVEIPTISSQLPYAITPLMYTSEGGILKTPHVVGNIAGNSEWTALYASNPDPALNLARIWMFKGVDHSTEEEIWEWVNDEAENPDARKIRGIFFRNANGTDLGVSLPLGDTVTIAVRVYNFSLHDCPAVPVCFEAVPYNSSTGEHETALSLGTVSSPRIDPWGAQNPNWQETTFEWDTSGLSEGNYKILVTLNPEGDMEELPRRALNEAFDNNQGWFKVFLHRKDSEAATAHAAESMGAKTTASNLKGELKLLSTPANGRTFEKGEQISFEGTIINENDTSARSIKVLFFDGNPDNRGKAFAGRIVPGILPGESYSLLEKHPFESEGTHHIYMQIVSKQGELSPENNTVSITFQVGDESSDGGCTMGNTGVWGALLLLGGFLPLCIRQKPDK